MLEEGDEKERRQLKEEKVMPNPQGKGFQKARGSIFMSLEASWIMGSGHVFVFYWETEFLLCFSGPVFFKPITRRSERQ